jgi:hypothetical protein
MAKEVFIGDIVQTRKTHPCGSDRWQIYRIGADIGMRCMGCERRVMLSRREYDKAVKKLISRLPEFSQTPQSQSRSQPESQSQQEETKNE